MKGSIQSIVLGLAIVGSVACSGTGSPAPSDDAVAGVQLQLTTTTPAGNKYRLGPATFEIREDYSGGPPLKTVEATGQEAELNVPLLPRSYDVQLKDGWVLSRLDAQGGATPVAATLTGPSAQYVRVEPYTTAKVKYAFHLGVSGIDIGIDVDEGIPYGYDGMIECFTYSCAIYFTGGGSACCYSSATEAQQAYPNLHLYAKPN